jgi:hypothetical protein
MTFAPKHSTKYQTRSKWATVSYLVQHPNSTQDKNNRPDSDPVESVARCSFADIVIYESTAFPATGGRVSVPAPG